MARLIGIIIALVPFGLTLAIGITGFRASILIDDKLQGLGYFLYWAGSLTCVVNFYLSFLRYPIHRWCFGEAQYHWVSGYPFLGTLFITLGLPVMPYSLWPVILCFVLLLVDTGGPLWFLISTWQDDSLWKRRRSNKWFDRSAK